jgi:hypothetical protein
VVKKKNEVWSNWFKNKENEQRWKRMKKVTGKMIRFAIKESWKISWDDLEESCKTDKEDK